MKREFVIFDVSGELAHFRRQYAITTALTYAIPPRTALCGLVGAVLGLPKNDSLRHFADGEAFFGFQLLRPVVTGHLSINLLQTKDARRFHGVTDFRPQSENPRTAMRYEVIRNPRYRVMFSHPTLGRQLADALRSGQSAYTPCLGLAWMIAWFESRVGVAQAQQCIGDHTLHPFVSPIRADDVAGDVHWNPEGVYQRVRMPAEMQPDRQVTRYEAYIIDTTGHPVETALNSYWKLADGTCFSAM